MNRENLRPIVMDSTSKVKVEYTDPSNIFSIFARELVPRLPLKDLHWSSSSRPTRSIDSLHVDFVSDEPSNSFSEPSLVQDSLDNQDQSIASKNDGPKKERRHQIPGLRRTPYLKIYLLSCGDVEIYRGSHRKQLRDWVKINTAPSQSNTALNKQHNHDAHEWLIIHVIHSPAGTLSDTSRPPSSNGDGTAEKRPSSSRWPSRTFATVVEKLQSDFNNTSKKAVDRVAQVQLDKPSPNGGLHGDRRMQDSDNGWDDLIFKLKSLILASFDSRVSQYEEDIREREGQKKVFGWNFNTFFVLKEGLALGFENMGLVEDALTAYQELAFGLNSAIEEQQMKGADQQTAHFVESTEDLHKAYGQARTFAKGTDKEDPSVSAKMVDPGTFVTDTSRKPFRDLILSNKISVFDFQCYVFARQLKLSLRLANASKTQPHSKSVSTLRPETGDEDVSLRDATALSKPGDREPENLLLLAEVVKSSAEFMTNMVSRVREDIQSGVHQSSVGHHEDQAIIESNNKEIIERFVLSWLFSASNCILDATCAISLTAQISPLLRQLTPSASGPEASVEGSQDANGVDVTHREDHPTRTSSLPRRRSAGLPFPVNEPASSVTSLDAARLLPPGNPHPGSQDLAAERGDLIALQRRVLGNLGSRHGNQQDNTAGTKLNYGIHINQLRDNALDEDSSNNAVDPPIRGKPSIAAGLCCKELLSAMESSQTFYQVHEVQNISTCSYSTPNDKLLDLDHISSSTLRCRRSK